MVSDPVEQAAAHRPYGLDCKCGRPINSDMDWARHFIDALGLTTAVRGPFFSGYWQRLVGPWVRVGEETKP